MGKVEEVAKAICDGINGEHGCGGFCHAVAKYGDAARAAIGAMKAPTEAMVDAAMFHEGLGFVAQSNAAIVAALSEDKEQG